MTERSAFEEFGLRRRSRVRASFQYAGPVNWMGAGGECEQCQYQIVTCPNYVLSATLLVFQLGVYLALSNIEGMSLAAVSPVLVLF